MQAIDCAHRIGQTKKVVVYRLLTPGSYEMEMFHRACLKLTLDHVVMASMTQGANIQAATEANSVTSRQDIYNIKANMKKKQQGAGEESAAPSGPVTAASSSSAVPFDRCELEVELVLKNGASNLFCVGMRKYLNGRACDGSGSRQLQPHAQAKRRKARKKL